MLALPFGSKATPVLKGEQVLLRLPASSDYHQWAALRHASRSFLEPWEPRWSVNELERSGWRQRLERNKADYKSGTGFGFLIFKVADGQLAGGLTIGNIRRGVAQSCQIGYWMGEAHAGRGYMLGALKLVIPYAFDELRLHRIEAACIPSNARSVRVLEKAGFAREGLARSYLRINGAWQDHFLYALVADDRFR
ncbi:GNAT family N-acetyltransferase [Tianweitania sediminis]|jgi:ribosomal-protein-alanine N-acetyltransferase|uniref:GNAT family N-acetyltransferase n=1 Tax=Tianweitania sediminis TaxID=1502156 RepID=A0A8J7UJN2_9HYPH|nr:GNAT family protein [Tianweitania sediminis]MBP0438809.1 GNAT family N-acetyltransferase [Tianweitania sediminis]HEV7416518.1 GNAT family protein [Tianweitania sediminis]